MSGQFDNAMTMAMDAYKAGNKEECTSFCNQALTVDPKSANAKALKGSAVLLSFTLAGAESEGAQAIEIWNSINDASSLSDEFKDIVIEAAFSFRSNWLSAAEAHYNEFSSVSGAKDEYKRVKECYALFMENVAALSWIQSYPKFLQLTLDLVKEQIASLKEVTFAEYLISVNKDKGGEIGDITKQIEEALAKLKKRRLIKWGIIIGAAAIFLIICAIRNNS